MMPGAYICDLIPFCNPTVSFRFSPSDPYYSKTPATMGTFPAQSVFWQVPDRNYGHNPIRQGQTRNGGYLAMILPAVRMNVCTDEWHGRTLLDSRISQSFPRREN